MESYYTLCGDASVFTVFWTTSRASLLVEQYEVTEAGQLDVFALFEPGKNFFEKKHSLLFNKIY